MLESNLLSVCKILNRGSELQEVIHRGAQIKKALEIAQKLGAENFLLDEIETLELFSVTDFSKNFRQHARLLKLTAGIFSLFASFTNAGY